MEEFGELRHQAGSLQALGVETCPVRSWLVENWIAPCTIAIIRVSQGARRPLTADESCVRRECGRCVSCCVSQMAVLGEVVPSGLLAPSSLLKHLRRMLAIAPHGLLVGCVVGSARVATADGSGQPLVPATPSKYLSCGCHR